MAQSAAAPNRAAHARRRAATLRSRPRAT